MSATVVQMKDADRHVRTNITLKQENANIANNANCAQHKVNCLLYPSRE